MTWLEDPLLAPDPAQPYLPGVNWLKRTADGQALLLSNSATRRLLRVALDAEGAPAGPVEVLAEMVTGIDDFVVAPDGTVYAATHTESLAMVQPGSVTSQPIAAPGVEGSTAVLLMPEGDVLLALGTGGLMAGGQGEAVLARVPLSP